ncbi:DNA-binding transcriptional LysR family regulator [Microbacterium resistens]|uniref:DNA-binding transcriptional LysR family regulator n=1 Tax=Microbacterium resistens TaxID=156977 RepID=A0ABU1SC58_9MICO|nr:LysR family transcriptional regulator [Microbacterium resistens]MDR6867197.1 DNA-binding transcriptional LysR family regulator [Microbacterium resistens]
MLSLPRLRLLSELHRRGTIAATAEALAYSASAVSQQLAQLERETSVPLLERVGRGVRLTPDAITLVAHAEAVFARLELAEADLAAAQPELRGAFRVASFQSVVLALAPSALRLLADRHPLLRVDITQREVDPAYEGLLSYDFDLILGEEYPGLFEEPRAGVHRADLLADPLSLVIPADGPYAVRPHRLADLANVPWALDPSDTPTGQWARAICRRAGFEPHVQFDSPDPLLHAHLVRSGLAVAIVPALLAPEHLTGLRLVSLPGNPHRVLYTAVRAGRADHPAVRAFREALADALAAQQPAAPAWSVLLDD